MCAVYRATRADAPDEQRAIKVLLDDDPALEQRFAYEAELLIALDHPNLLDVYELHPADPEREQPAWIVMELLAGHDLEAHRDRADPLGPEQVARWMADIAQGLQTVHDRGVMHRDIKPSNIMLGDDGLPRLIDFGIARVAGSARLTTAGMVVGTASYLPPEVFTSPNPGELQDQPPTDVYALGQTLCELLINRAIHDPKVFKGADRMTRIMSDKLSRPYLDPREWDSKIPAGLAQIVIDATKQEPDERIGTAAELERRLRAWLTDRSRRDQAPVNRVDVSLLPPPPGRPSMPPTPPPSRRGAGVALLGAGAIGVVGVGGIGIVIALALVVVFGAVAWVVIGG